MVKVVGIDFSRGAYQVEVSDKKQTFFSFLQFDSDDVLSDAFCSCEEEELCDHLSASLLKIYNNQSEPLHVRFYASLWNVICRIFFEDSSGLSYTLNAKTASAKKRLKAILENRARETPETSLKFSNLPPEEITHWKEGRPSADLRYELSPWSDIAKWMMFEEEAQIPYELKFEEKEGLPLILTISWPDLKATFHYTAEQLPLIIPTLASLNSPLKVHREKEELITAMHYNSDEEQIEVKRRAPKKTFADKGIKLDGWFYVKAEGFYPEVCPDLLTKEIITKEEIPTLLKDYGDLVEKFLPLYKSPEVLKYTLFFDDEWNLHVDSYLFEKGDLKKGFFKNYAHIEGRGFFPLSNPLFDKSELIVTENQVPHFIHKYRNWILGISGFSIHLSSFETTLSYEVNKRGMLRFFSTEESQRFHDFGELIYLEGQGFFTKRSFSPLSIMAGLEIPPHDVASFIKMRKEELISVAGFFSDESPLTKRGVDITLEENEIHIKPHVELKEDLQDRFYHFFDGFIFVQGNGFSEIPPEMFLRERYNHEVIIPEKEQPLFFREEWPKLKKVALSVDSRLKEPPRLEIEVSSLAKDPEGGMRGHFYYKSDLGILPADDIYNALLAKKKYLYSEAGRIDLSDERFSWVLKIKNSNPDHESALSTVDFLRLDQSESIHAQDDISRKILSELRQFEVDQKPNIKGLQSTLRLYQETGLHWLWFLYKNDLSGLLCDDMGLGKTHQAMALIAAAINEKKGSRFLIVAPTSVIYHWQEKLTQFLPKVKVQFFHGIKRTLKRLPKEGIVLTSYGILRLERQALEKIPFEIAIFDEMQVAKNPSSQLHDALLKIKAKMVLGLSGTPIENNLRELKALFDIALPGFLPPESRFRDQFILPIEREGSSERKQELSKVIKPFILRRKKKDVLQELPEKTEDKNYAELSDQQQELYLATLEKNRKTVITELEKGEAPIPYVHIFSILSTLKQVCDHPALVHKDPQNYKNYSSGKWDLFVELLTEALEGEQKVVVFSQYLNMLDIMQNYLQENGIGYAQIRGDTRNRREEMRRFQEDPNCQVFIGTLQAAGLGIDLTAASIVILYDRWWNAARENQAIDRVHRIGQKWGVQVYKLITKGTIEEKIDALITRKGQLLEEIVLADDEAEIKKFTREEILDLLTFSPTKE